MPLTIKDVCKSEKLAEQLHIWYLEATKELNPKSFNPNAQKQYKDLTEEQKFIDKYIAERIKDLPVNIELDEEKMAKIIHQHRHTYGDGGEKIIEVSAEILAYILKSHQDEIIKRKE